MKRSMKLKKCLAGCLAMLMAFSCMLAFSSCKASKGSSGLKLELDEDNPYYVVTGIGTCTDKTVYIPSEYEGLPVKAIGKEAFKNCTSFTKIVIPDSVETIEYEAFSGCTSLKHIDLSKNISAIGYQAFYRCKNLQEIELPENITWLSEGCFYWCTSLKKIVIPEGVTSIPEHAFYGCSSLEDVSLPESLEHIGHQAFDRNDSLVSITIPRNVEILFGWPFNDCANLKTIYYYGPTEGLDWMAERKNPNCTFIYCD